jgi:DNA mismatch endonuclease (patch repair protein)
MVRGRPVVRSPREAWAVSWREVKMDKISPMRRSANMAAVRNKDTRPEMLVRRAAHGMGLRFRLHRKDLPGRPDLVFPKWRTVVFVNGCFWHGHQGCKRAKLPSSNVHFWRKKLLGNVQRDLRNYKELNRLGWRVCIIWQCDIKSDIQALAAVKRLKTIGGSPGRAAQNLPDKSRAKHADPIIGVPIFERSPAP